MNSNKRLIPLLFPSSLCVQGLSKWGHPSYRRGRTYRRRQGDREDGPRLKTMRRGWRACCVCVFFQVRKSSMARCLVLTVVSECVCVCVCVVDVSFLEPACWVAWRGVFVCVCVCECRVSLFVFGDRLSVMSPNRWMCCELEKMGRSHLAFQFEPQSRPITTRLSDEFSQKKGN